MEFCKVLCLDQFYSPYMYKLALDNINKKHTIKFHCYADDIQVYLSMKPEETNQLAKQAYLNNIKIRMNSNFLLLNSNGNEVVYLSQSTQETHYLMIYLLRLALNQALGMLLLAQIARGFPKMN